MRKEQQEQRLRRQIKERQKQWDLLTEKLARLEKDQILETTTTGKFRLEHEIADTRAEHAQIEKQLTDLENQVTPIPDVNAERAQIEKQLTDLENQVTPIPDVNPVQEFLGNRSGGQRLFAFGVTLCLFSAVLAFHLLQSRLPAFAAYRLPAEILIIEIALFLLSGFFLISYLRRDTTAMKVHPTPLEKEFPEKGYKQRLQSFCGVLLDDLNKIDRETNWSAEYFTPLDAEVEMQSGDKRLKKVTDLLSAIRSDRKSKVFLVIGDPGSGKSVALRKLCRDLLHEVEKTGKVPLYINLREWEVAEKWTEEHPPTAQQLYDFVLKNLKERGDVFANEFLDRYFKPMFDYGRFFIVLDSFDEIPAVLDTETSSWLIDKLSEVIYKFLAGAHQSRGMLASRIFRKPTHNFQAKTTLEIRPFTETKIIETFRKSLLHDSEPLTKLLFKERQEFVPIARNPFTAALIVSYVKEHNNTLPQTQAELYSDYITRRLNLCYDRIKKKNLTITGIIQRAADIADLMFTTPEFGLEVSVETLKATFSQNAIEDEIAILTYGRLGRVGGGEEHRFSFAHRRFQEYFVARRLLENPEGLTLEAIPIDSRWRDALVLYCEVAPEAEARKIAEFCWSEISKIHEENLNMSDPQYLRAIHSLRFLKDAFHSRLDYLISFREQLATFIERQVKSGDLLSVKLAVEALGLLQRERIDSAIIKALNIENIWISETAFKACRHLSRLSHKLELRIAIHLFTRIDSFSFFQRRRELLFSLNLSNGFITLFKLAKTRIIDLYFFILGSLSVFAMLIFHIYWSKYYYVTPLHLMFLTILSLWLLYLLLPLLIRKYYSNTHSERDSGIFITRFIVLMLGIHSFNSYADNFLFWPFVLGSIFIFIFLSPWWHIFTAIFLSKRKIYDLKESFSELIVPLPPELRKDLTKYVRILTIFIVFTVLFLLLFPLISPFLQDYQKEFSESFENLMISAKNSRMFNFTLNIAKIGSKILNILFIFVLLIFLGVSGYLEILTPLKNSRKDRKEFEKISRLPKLARENISEQFYRFKTSQGRLKYIKLLQAENVIVEGEWLGGKLPNVNNDEASTLLAQLEEKWLGLDR